MMLTTFRADIFSSEVIDSSNNAQTQHVEPRWGEQNNAASLNEIRLIMKFSYLN